MGFYNKFISVSLLKITILTLPFVFATTLFSQEIVINTGDSVLIESLIVKKEKNKQTSYYKQDTSCIAQIAYFSGSDTIGTYLEFYPNGKLYRKIIFDLNGLRHGDYRVFSPKGNLLVSGQYRHGKKQGLWYFVKKKRYEVYRKGKKHGRWRIYEGTVPWTLYVYKKDSLVRVKKYNPR